LLTETLAYKSEKRLDFRASLSAVETLVGISVFELTHMMHDQRARRGAIAVSFLYAFFAGQVHG